MLAMGIAHRKGERSQALKGRNTIPFGIMELMVRSAGSYFPHEKLLKEGELDRNSAVAKNATVQMEADREVKREIEYYNLDAILSVGYRVKP